MTIQTKSPLVLRDIETLRKFEEIEAGFSTTTADDRIRRIFEPGAPPIRERIRALDVLHSGGIRTFAMIAPILPGAEGLTEELAGKVDHILIDRLNYSYANRVYQANGMEWALKDDFFIRTTDQLKEGFLRRKIPVQVVF